MKSSIWLGALTFAICIPIQAQVAAFGSPNAASPSGPSLPADEPQYHITERGPHHRIWERVTYVPNPLGAAVPKVHRYTELATGMHYMEGGQWTESREQVESCPGGAQAVHGQHKAFFGNNLATDPIVIVMPSGRCLTNHIAGLSYYDTASGKSVLFAETKDCQGAIQAPNQITYPDAFEGCRANVRYTYSRWGVEQDVILAEQPPAPETFGLPAATTIIEVVTEFIDSPQPQVTTAESVASATDSVPDENLEFSSMRFGRGRVFSVGESKGAAQIRVSKQWLQMEGRHFLLERVPVPKLQKYLRALPIPPEGASVDTATNSLRRLASVRRALPPCHLAQSKPHNMEVASLALPANGLVFDYVAVDQSPTNYNHVFKSDETSLVSGNYWLSGTTVLEGGCVIKYASGMNSSPSLILGGPLDCKTGPYRPAVLTSSDDNTIGEIIGTSNGRPVTGNGCGFDAEGPIPAGTAWQFSNLRVSYLFNGVLNYSGVDSVFSDCQFVNCSYGAGSVCDGTCGTITLQNCLFVSSYCPVGTDFRVNAVNVTADNCEAFCYNYNSLSGLTLTNCLLSRSWRWYDGDNGYLPAPVLDHTVTVPNPIGVFQTVGAAGYYLAQGSTNRNAGTANISSNLLADLQQKTTYPPIVYSNATLTTDTTFSPQAQRDTDVPDLGYHYDPIDYAFGGCNAYANLTFSPGTAVGWFRTSSGWNHQGHGIHLGNSLSATYHIYFNGMADAPAYWVRCNLVQEQSNPAWYPGGDGMGGITSWATTYPVPEAWLRFTRCISAAGERSFIADDYGAMFVHLQDCELHGGGLGYYCNLITLTNCLVDRSILQLHGGILGRGFILQNCTFHGGYFISDRWQPNGDGFTGFATVAAHDCAFDGTSISTTDAHATDPAYTSYGFNAYLAGATQTDPPGANDQTVTNFNWQSSWLGDYYLPSDSPLKDADVNITADLMGLYHYTTQTNFVDEQQEIEGSSQLDAGYHYVAVDINGHPLDNDGDGSANYIEDANGNGLVNSGETDWNNAGDLGLKVLITRPKSNSTIP